MLDYKLCVKSEDKFSKEKKEKRKILSLKFRYLIDNYAKIYDRNDCIYYGEYEEREFHGA